MTQRLALTGCTASLVLAVAIACSGTPTSAVPTASPSATRSATTPAASTPAAAPTTTATPGASATASPTVSASATASATASTPRPTPAATTAPPPAAPSVTTVNVSISNFTFAAASGPAPLVVRWTNKDAVDHDVSGNDGKTNTPNIPPGATAELRFDRPTTFTYACSIHPFMTGTVIVR